MLVKRWLDDSWVEILTIHASKGLEFPNTSSMVGDGRKIYSFSTFVE
jgi:hypothetical protein